MDWQNNDLVLYHGCSDQSLFPVNPGGIAPGVPNHQISPSAGSKRPDFGPGFYATSWIVQAQSWANLRALKLRQRYPNVKAVVLELCISRNMFAKLETLFFTSDRSDYFPFVRYCRNGNRPHAPKDRRNDPYDVIIGPVSVGFQPLVIQSSDQICFHTRRATSIIPPVSVHSVGDPLFAIAQ